MKNIIIISLLFILCLGFEGICNTAVSCSQIPIAREIQILIITTGSGAPSPRPRSVVDIVEAQIDTFSNQRFISFSESVGCVTVDVTNSIGQVVMCYSCDTAMESVIYMSIPNAPGHYTITVDGNDFEAYGSYEIADGKY